MSSLPSLPGEDGDVAADSHQGGDVAAQGLDFDLGVSSGGAAPREDFGDGLAVLGMERSGEGNAWQRPRLRQWRGSGGARDSGR